MLDQYERFGLLNGASASGPTSGTEPTRPSMSNLLVPDQAVTQALAEEGAVLLKNQSSVLPLTSSDLSSGVLVVGATGRQLLNNTGERSKGVPERNMISPLAQLQALAGSSAKITYLPGIDWVGQAIGSGSDTTAAAYKLTGSFTVTDSTATSGTAATSVDGHAVPTLGTTTVTGTITAPTAGNYYIWLRGKTLSSAGTGYNSAHYSAFTSASGGIPGNAGSSSSGSALTVNGTSVSLANTPVEPETFWSSGLDGYVSIGALVSLTAGANPITATFSAASISATDFPAGLTVKLSYSSPDATQAAAVAAAATAKKVIIFANDNGTSETTTADDVIPRLDQNNDALVAAVAAANTNNAVVLNIGNPVAMPWLSAVSSILVMWYPGQEGGTATADLLLGTANPGGRLPITFPVKTEDTPFEGDYYAVRQAGVLDANSITYSNLTEGIFSGYRWYDQMGIAPMFAFGEGLSYTTFKYSGLSIKNTSDGFIATFTVTNTGKVSGAVVPQLYLGSSSAVSSDIQQAKKKLVGFDRVTLASGASTQVSMTVTGQQLSYWSTATQAWVKPAGQRAVYVSDNARDSAIQLTSSVTM
jgi:beta-glucosidase